MILTMLIYAMSVSADGYINDRDGAFDWPGFSDELFEAHLERVASLGGYILGRRLYENMTVWETDPAMRQTPTGAAFADVWTALPKVVFSRTLTGLVGNARLATGSVAEEVAAALRSGDVEIGGADVAGQAVELGLVDEFRMFRFPVVTGGGTPYFPPVIRDIALDLVETRGFGERVVYERYRRAH